MINVKRAETLFDLLESFVKYKYELMKDFDKKGVRARETFCCPDKRRNRKAYVIVRNITFFNWQYVNQNCN